MAIRYTGVADIRLGRTARRAGTASGAVWQVSTAGGNYPKWRPDGKELYYLNAAGAMMAAPISVAGAALTPGAPIMLFPTRIFGGGVDSAQGRQFRQASAPDRCGPGVAGSCSISTAQVR